MQDAETKNALFLRIPQKMASGLDEMQRNAWARTKIQALEKIREKISEFHKKSLQF